MTDKYPCPICGEQVTLTGERTKDGRLIGSCLLEYDAGIETCPRRYLSPHGERFNALVAKCLDYRYPKTRGEHTRAILLAREEYDDATEAFC